MFNRLYSELDQSLEKLFGFVIFLCVRIEMVSPIFYFYREFPIDV